MVGARQDEFWHIITADQGGIYIGWSHAITSHLTQHRDRPVLDFTRRVSQIVQWRAVNPTEFKLEKNESKIIKGALTLMRQSHEGQFRRSGYYSILLWKYTDEKRPYSTHVEGVVELFAWFFRELEIPRHYFLPAIVVAIFHDGIEDASPEMQIEMAAFLRANFSSEYPQMIESLFALSHLNDEKYERSSTIFWLPEIPNSRAIETNRTKSNGLAHQIHDEILLFSQELFAQWKSGSLPPHDLPFRAPKDGALDAYLASEIWKEWSVAYQLNTECGFDTRRIRLLYRFVIHSYYIWWKQHRMPDSIAWEEKFFRRIEWDIASMLQVSLYSIPRNSMLIDGKWIYRELTLPEDIVLPIKFPDQIYNAWDNHYLTLMESGDERDHHVFKTMLLSFRVRYYQELLIQSIGQNSPIHQLMREVTERLDRVILTPLATSLGHT